MYITTNNAYPFTADSCGTYWDFSDVVISCQMSSEDFFSWMRRYWPSTNMENMPWRAQAFLGQPELFSATRIVEALSTRLNTPKPWVSRGTIWHMEDCIQHCLCTCSSTIPSPMTISVSTCPFSSASFLQPTFPFPSVSLCLSHLLLFYSLDSWLSAHAGWPYLQLTPRFPCPFSAERPLSMEKTQQLLFIFISYNRGKGLALLWEPAALFPPLLPSQKSGFPTYCWGHTWHPAVAQVGLLHKNAWTGKAPSRSLPDIQVYTLHLHPTTLP